MAKGESRGIWVYVIILVIGALFGTVLGEAIGAITPQGPIRDFFIKSIGPGLNPAPTLDLIVLTITLGFTIKLNVCSVIGILVGGLLIRKI
ncbi:MAG: DUF4321 domain-containing protein [Candidatus Firestonebacteria bacterium]